MNDQEIDKLIREALHQEQELPEGLSDRLEQQIDRLAAEEEKRHLSLMKKRSIYWFGSIAASLIIGFFIFFQVENHRMGPEIADTFKDPHEAAIAAQDALAFLSSKLNQGLEPVNDVNEELRKANTIVMKQFEVLNKQ